MAITQDTVILNNPSDWAGLARRERTTSTGTHVRYSVNVTSQAIVTDFGAMKKAVKTGLAIRDLLKRKIQAISATVTTATKHKRAMMSNAATSPRYTGGRMGYLPPGRASADRLFNDSGRLAEGLEVRRNAEEEGFTINVPAARLNPSTFGGGEPALLVMWQRLVALVPEFAGGAKIFEDSAVMAALHDDVVDAIVVADAAGRAALSRGRSALWGMIARDAIKVFTIGG